MRRRQAGAIYAPRNCEEYLPRLPSCQWKCRQFGRRANLCSFWRCGEAFDLAAIINAVGAPSLTSFAKGGIPRSCPAEDFGGLAHPRVLTSQYRHELRLPDLFRRAGTPRVARLGDRISNSGQTRGFPRGQPARGWGIRRLAIAGRPWLVHSRAAWRLADRCAVQASRRLPVQYAAISQLSVE